MESVLSLENVKAIMMMPSIFQARIYLLEKYPEQLLNLRTPLFLYFSLLIF